MMKKTTTILALVYILTLGFNCQRAKKKEVQVETTQTTTSISKETKKTSKTTTSQPAKQVKVLKPIKIAIVFGATQIPKNLPSEKIHKRIENYLIIADKSIEKYPQLLNNLKKNIKILKPQDPRKKWNVFYTQIDMKLLSTPNGFGLPASFKLTASREIPGKQIAELVDGNDVTYQAHGVRKGYEFAFKNQIGKENVYIQIFDMGTMLNAYAIFSRELPQKPFLPISIPGGGYGYQEQSQLIFIKDKYYVKIQVSQAKTPRMLTLNIAKAICKAIKPLPGKEKEIIKSRLIFLAENFGALSIGTKFRPGSKRVYYDYLGFKELPVALEVTLQ